MSDLKATIATTRESLGDLDARYTIPHLPRLEIARLNQLLGDFQERGGFSDIYLATGHPLRLRAHGALIPVNPRSLQQNEMEGLVNSMYGPNGSTETSSKGAIDFPHEFTRGDVRLRYRVNVSLMRAVSAASGFSMVMRPLSADPPRIQDLGIEEALLQGAYPRKGIVWVTGPTGSGKTTTLAAIMRSMLESVDDPKAILTIEAPIEFVYDSVKGEAGKPISGFVWQSEVPTMFKSFKDAIKADLRRHPDVILVGEARDQETIAAAVEAAMTGHTVYTTIHTNSVPETLRRVILAFPPDQRGGMLADLIAATELIVTQVLVPGVKRSMCALREYLRVTDKVREALYRAGEERLVETVIELVESDGQSMLRAAEIAFARGDISERILARFKGRNKLITAAAEAAPMEVC